MPGSIRESRKDYQGAKSDAIALESLYLSLSSPPPRSLTNADTVGKWSPEPSFRQEFLEARCGSLVGYTSVGGGRGRDDGRNDGL